MAICSGAFRSYLESPTNQLSGRFSFPSSSCRLVAVSPQQPLSQPRASGNGILRSLKRFKQYLSSSMGLEQDTEHKPERGQAFRKRFQPGNFVHPQYKEKCKTTRKNVGESAGHISLTNANECSKATPPAANQDDHIQTLCTHFMLRLGNRQRRSCTLLGAQPTSTTVGTAWDLTPP